MEKARNSYTTMILIMVVALPLCCAASPEGPSVVDIINDSGVKAAVEEAWRNSSLSNPGMYKINGGWVYAASNDPSALIVRHADKCRSLPGSVEQAKNNSERVEIYLDYPENDQSSPPPPPGYKLVADFHTHPFPGVYQTPDDEDVVRSYNRDVPGLVYSSSGIFWSGPLRRASLDGPAGYPGNCFMYYGQNYVRIDDAHFPDVTY
eukprot:Gb_15706 [translate_table: standard]